jgi:uncharacterized hydrophobic protein (TIGR00271 family)
VLYLRAYVPASRTSEITSALDALSDVRHVVRIGTSVGGDIDLISADVEPRAADAVLAELGMMGVDVAEVTLSRAVTAGPVEAGHQRWIGSRDALVWAEVVDSARENARLFARYVVLMAIAGIIAAIGVIESNSILIVGAMAVSPDLLPVSAACVGIVGRRPWLTVRSITSLLIGLFTATLGAFLVTELLIGTGYLSSDFTVGAGGLGTLTTINITTVIIAFVAGIAGMLTFETRAGAAVGVAISVTTIPAAAYTGVALAGAAASKAIGSLDVLGTNVLMLLLGGTLTLAVQRLLRTERGIPDAPDRGP